MSRPSTTVIFGVLCAVVTSGAILLAQSVHPVRLDSAPETFVAADTGGGWLVWQGELTNNTAQTVLASGTLNTTPADGHGAFIRVIIDPSSGACTFANTQLVYGTLTQEDWGTNVQFKINPDGSFTVQRVAGTATYKIVMRVLWI